MGISKEELLRIKAIFEKNDTGSEGLINAGIWCQFCGSIHGEMPLQRGQTLPCEDFFKWFWSK